MTIPLFREGDIVFIKQSHNYLGQVMNSIPGKQAKKYILVVLASRLCMAGRYGPTWISIFQYTHCPGERLTLFRLPAPAIPVRETRRRLCLLSGFDWLAFSPENEEGLLGTNQQIDFQTTAGQMESGGGEIQLLAVTLD